MTAFFTVELDTTAPVAILGEPSFDHLTRILTIPVEVDEVGILGAEFASDSGQRVAMGITSNELVGQVPVGVSREGTVEVTTRDEVLNTGFFTRTVASFLQILDSVAYAVARIASMIAARARTGARTGAAQVEATAVSSARARFDSESAVRRT